MKKNTDKKQDIKKNYKNRHIILIIALIFTIITDSCGMYFAGKIYYKSDFDLTKKDYIVGNDNESDFWTGSDEGLNSEGVPIITYDRFVDDSLCTFCGHNYSDEERIRYYELFNKYYITRDSSDIIKNLYKTESFSYITDSSEHKNPLTGEKCNITTWGNFQPIKELPYHTNPTINKIYPKVQYTCTKENWNTSLQGQIVLSLKYTGQEQHPIYRVISDNKIIPESDYDMFFRKINDNPYIETTYDKTSDYDLITIPGESTLGTDATIAGFNIDTIPKTDSCIEPGYYAAIIRFRSTSDLRGQMVTYFTIIETPKPTPTPTIAPQPTFAPIQTTPTPQVTSGDINITKFLIALTQSKIDSDTKAEIKKRIDNGRSKYKTNTFSSQEILSWAPKDSDIYTELQNAINKAKIENSQTDPTTSPTTNPATTTTPATEPKQTATPTPQAPTTQKEAKQLTVKSLKLSTGKKKIKTKWKKTKGAKKYQVQIATNKSFSKGKKSVKTSKNTYTFKKLKAKKKYYVRIRTISEVNGKIVYGKWTKVKSLKTK